MVFAVLVLLFADIAQPVTILVSLAAVDRRRLLALLLTGYPISLPVVIGILMLLGIVTKNAILLVDFAIEAMAAGTARTEALVEAGRKRGAPGGDDHGGDDRRHGPSVVGLGEARLRSPMAAW